MKFVAFFMLMLLSACIKFKAPKQLSLDITKIQSLEISKFGLDTSFQLETTEIEMFVKAWNSATPKGPMKYAKVYMFQALMKNGDTLSFLANNGRIISDCELEDEELLNRIWNRAYDNYLAHLPKPKKKIDISDQPCQALPCCACDKAIIYEIKSNGNGWPEDVFTKRTAKNKLLTKSELSEFIDLLNNPSSYGNSVAACHIPRIGLVCYDSTDTPCSYLTLCLECNNLKSKPDFLADFKPAYLKGFSKPTRKKLRHIFEKWGFPDVNSSDMFD